jgi:hypothetical protein
VSLAFAKRRDLMCFRKNAVPNGSTLQCTSFVSTKISLKTYIASSRLTWPLLLEVLSLAITLYSSCPGTPSTKPRLRRIIMRLSWSSRRSAPNVPLHCAPVEASKCGKSSAVDGRISALRTLCIRCRALLFSRAVLEATQSAGMTSVYSRM